MAEEATTPAATEPTPAAPPETNPPSPTPDTLLGKPGEGTQGEGTQTAEKPTGAPEAYAAFTVPEGFTLDQALVDQFAPLFKESNLSQEAAQKLVDAYASSQKASAEAQSKAAEEGAKQLQADWVKEFKADPEFGGANEAKSLKDANRAFEALATPAEITAIREFGLLNYPPLVRILARAGALMGESGTFHSGGSPETRKSDEEVFYGQ